MHAQNISKCINLPSVLWIGPIIQYIFQRIMFTEEQSKTHTHNSFQQDKTILITHVLMMNYNSYFLSLSVNVIPCLLTLKLTKTGSCSLFFPPGSIFDTAYLRAACPVRDSTLNEPRYATLQATHK